jgi:hypothetical protein
MRMETRKLREELKRGGQLQSLLLRYSLVLLKQVSQIALPATAITTWVRDWRAGRCYVRTE